MGFLKNKLAVVIIILSVTFLSLIGYSANREKISFVENGVGVTINSVQGIFYGGFHKIKGSFKFITNLSNIKAQNEKLLKTNSELQVKALEYDTAIKENERLRKMLNFSTQRDEYNYVGAEIRGLSGNSFSDGFIINKGTNKGIKKNMIAMTGDGLVGQVTSVADDWATVQCLSNENIAVAGLVQRTRDNNGMVKGYKDENNKLLAEIQHLSVDSSIKKDDIIVTSGLAGKYPAKIRIGKVLSVHEDKGEVMKSAIIEPYVDFSKIEEVFIVVPKHIKDGEIIY
ncbi:rod shape-determining protein MreC [Clostridium sp. CM028]|uniref:rod shape-determining protein MreC n=1 Tax=unclassified Clostridium TaxID=2614128 RepID=UPI001C0BAD12|nr:MULTISPECIES: rod shape-determining protein MreC [unclassified Clostridium]MBU3090667.1 rod shape-determining protein MreC [Clostridium sp. CF011]MBW9144339.1 rod shape-determining protein MreC [Clostridium sp. CM027]MBW9149423.1 rod shape-determining protein MreC [Clostridium sp. CM028]UVE41029.1 rod shape-determining protein MreC [Clostridium sp. CM027]WAG70018.1 rod shape-determining protein MreC [Clostridium sp. CF011]